MFSPNETKKGMGVAGVATAHLEFVIVGEFARAAAGGQS
jgi:hypothetical protein